MKDAKEKQKQRQVGDKRIKSSDAGKISQVTYKSPCRDRVAAEKRSSVQKDFCRNGMFRKEAETNTPNKSVKI